MSTKAKVFRAVNGRWYWGHQCTTARYISGPVYVGCEFEPPVTGCRKWALALVLARAHVRKCCA